MARVKTMGTSNKASFGRRKTGNAQKSFNKHTPRPKKYFGQGRS